MLTSLLCPLKLGQEGKSRLDFAFAPYRGGFELSFGEYTRRNKVSLFGGLVAAYLNDEGTIMALQSYWDHGGLPIRTLHQIRMHGGFMGGQFDVVGERLTTEVFCLHQQPGHFALWFSTEQDMPLSHWTIERHPELKVALYLSSRKAKGGWPVPGVGGHGECNMLAGIELALEKTVAQYPIRLARFVVEDFKG
jgi:hypothetical protein